MLQKALRDSDIENLRFYDLRHTYAVTSIHSSDDIKTVQENLGHHTAAFTLDQYGHVTETMRRDSADRMQAFIKAIPNALKVLTLNSIPLRCTVKGCTTL